jgi:hypothetical protein
MLSARDIVAGRMSEAGHREIRRLELVEPLPAVEDAEALRHQQPLVAARPDQACSASRSIERDDTDRLHRVDDEIEPLLRAERANAVDVETMSRVKGDMRERDRARAGIDMGREHLGARGLARQRSGSRRSCVAD